MMKTSLFSSLAVAGFVMSSVLTPAHAEDSIYGALYEAGNLVSTNEDSLNTESVLMYHADYPGFIAITTNSAGAEWWTSNAAGTVWTQSTTNPLDGYGCVGVGRHAIATYGNEVYFGAQCNDGSADQGLIFKLTSKDTVELMHTHSAESGDFVSFYPTAAVVGENLYMFYNGGFTQFDGTTFTEVTDAEGQMSGVPLEASQTHEGVVYLPVGGTVQSFDGTAYTTIGEEYLEGATDSTNKNLPAIDVFNDTIYVGNQDFDSGATLFRYDPEDTDADLVLWEEAAQLDSGDNIINKMQVSDEIDGTEYLVFYTANASTGSNIYVMDESETLTKLVDSGLGNTGPENNVEVISAIKRTVEFGPFTKKVMVFSTKNQNDQTKIFILNLGDRLAIDALAARIISEAVDGMSAEGFRAQQNEDETVGTTALGETFEYKIKKSRVRADAVYSLWINGERVDKVIGEKDTPVVLSYEGAAELEAGDSFEVQIGVRHAYGRKNTRIHAANVIMGEALTVTVQ